MNFTLQYLLEIHATGVLSGLQEVFKRPVLNFRRDLYPSLCLLDSQIPGIGMQYAIWSETTPHYPFSQEFDGVVRPLRYVPYHLASGIPFKMMARDIVANSGGHLEECLKELCASKDMPMRDYLHASLGSLARKPQVRLLLGEKLTKAIKRFCQISWNQAKHQYSSGYPKSVISVEDAIGSYFVARALGAEVLLVANRMNALIEAIEDARRIGSIYVTGELPTVVDDETPWRISEIDSTDRDEVWE